MQKICNDEKPVPKEGKESLPPNSGNKEIPLLMSAGDIAKRLGVGRRTWYSWDQLGTIPKPMQLNRKLFWRWEEILAWIDADCPKRENWVYKPAKRKAL